MRLPRGYHRRTVSAEGSVDYSNLAIRTALTLRVVFGLPLRQTEGFLDSLLSLMSRDLKAPDHTTLSRRVHSWVGAAGQVEPAVAYSPGFLRLVAQDSNGHSEKRHRKGSQ